MTTYLVYHYLILTHHGSHYDWNIWSYYTQYVSVHGYRTPWPAVKRVFSILARAGL